MERITYSQARPIVESAAELLGFEPDKYRDAMFLYWPDYPCPDSCSVVAYEHKHSYDDVSRMEFAILLCRIAALYQRG